MLNEKQQQAKNLYFQTDLTKTQIADVLSISRRSLHYWIRENNWDRLKKSATHLPAMLAENCYLIISQFTNAILSEDRIKRPVTVQEADTLHKLALTVKKLKNHSTLNESMEMFAHFMERVNKISPQLADQLTPFVSDYMEERAAINPATFMPAKLNAQGFIPVEQQDNTELHKDIADNMAWEYETDNNATDNVGQSPDTGEQQQTIQADVASPALLVIAGAVDNVNCNTDPALAADQGNVPPVEEQNTSGAKKKPSFDDLRNESVAYATNQVRDGNMTWMEAHSYLSDAEIAYRKEILAMADKYAEIYKKRNAA